MSKTVGSRYRVTLADGEQFEIQTDERDWAAMEAREFPDAALLTKVRYNVWNAAKREGIVRRSWEQFNTQDCVSAEDISDDGPEDKQGLDPGQTITSEPGGSTSPSSPVNRSRARRGSSTGTRGT